MDNARFTAHHVVVKTRSANTKSVKRPSIGKPASIAGGIFKKISAPSQVIAKSKSGSTSVWGTAESGGDFLKVPRAVIYLRSLENVDSKYSKLKSHHLHLMLLLAAKKYKKKLIRAYWVKLGHDLGAKKDTVRKWAYQLEKMGLLKIQRFRKRTDGILSTPGFRNDKNTFDISPFVTLVEQRHAQRKDKRAERKKRRAVAGEGE